jgi:hypothetical protein
MRIEHGPLIYVMVPPEAPHAAAVTDNLLKRNAGPAEMLDPLEHFGGIGGLPCGEKLMVRADRRRKHRSLTCQRLTLRRQRPCQRGGRRHGGGVPGYELFVTPARSEASPPPRSTPCRLA